MRKLFLIIAFALSSVTSYANGIYTVTTSAPGGVPDTLARQLTLQYDKLYNNGESTAIFNLPGGDGLVGIRQFNKNTIDKNGVLFPGTGHVVNLNETDYQKLTPLVEVVKQPWVFAVRSDFPAKNWQEFVDYAKTKPGQVSVAITSEGLTMPGALRIEKNHGITLNYILYSKNVASYTDLYAGVVDATWVPASAYFGTAMNTKSRAILVAGKKNIPGIPNDVLYGDDKKVGEWYLHQGIFVNQSMPTEEKKLLTLRFNTIIHDHWGPNFQSKNPGVLLGNTDTSKFIDILRDFRKDWAHVKSTVQK